MARDVAELQARLDIFCRYYNEQRPHQGIGRVTPLSRWLASSPSSAGKPLPHPMPPPTPHPVKVNATGVVRVNELKIGVGVRWAGCNVTVILDERFATIFHNGRIVRHLHLDHTRTYQPTRRPPGGPLQPRHLQS